MSEALHYIREVSVQYKGARRRRPEPAINGPDGLAAFVQRIIGAESQEHFVAVFLDNRHKPIGWRVISIGTASAAMVHPRETFQPALLIGAAAIIVAHNHPSGDPRPSESDVSVTTRLREAGELLGVRVMDHVIVGATLDRVFSFRSEGGRYWPDVASQV